jgi:hypothetical protein
MHRCHRQVQRDPIVLKIFLFRNEIFKNYIKNYIKCRKPLVNFYRENRNELMTSRKINKDILGFPCIFYYLRKH